jgi:GNAT superfamily N-acetyltransferase
MPAFTIDELAIPASLDGPDAADFRATVDVRNAVETEGYGTDELNFTAEELHPHWIDHEYEPKRLFVARVDGAIVARAIYEVQPEDTGVAWVSIQVLAEHRNRGIGSALADALDAIAVAESKSKLIVYTVSKTGEGGRIAPPTGFGSVPAGNAEVRFLLARGYTLEQVERGSRLALPVDADLLRTKLAEASAAAGDDYMVHSWSDRTPERWQADMAHLFTRMSTDAPSAGLDEPEDLWSIERLIAAEDRLDAGPRSTLAAAIEHVPTGRLIAYTTLSLPAEPDRPVSQEDTLVLREHRGHRLGMLLKVANLLNLEREHPGYPSVITFNAEENRHMLDVNEAVGFVPMGYEGAWKRMLTPTPE